MTCSPIPVLLLGVLGFAAGAVRLRAQTLNAAELPDAPAISSAVDGDNSAPVAGNVAPTPIAPTYHPPSQRTRFHNYFYEAFGPYPIVAEAFTAGVNQLTDSPPEWREGAEAYGKRFGSNMGIVATSTTTRYVLSEAMQEDLRYYRCGCTGFFPRLSHAMIATLTARRGDDGHHVFSVPALLGPYVGTTTAVYAWYPSRYSEKDAFRMGNYAMLGYMGQNISIEFLSFDQTKSLLSKFHLNNRRAAPGPDSPPTPGASPNTTPGSDSTQ